MKTYDIGKLDTDTQFNLGYRAFHAGRPLDNNKPVHWRRGWQAAFADVMREHEAVKRGNQE